MDRRVNYLHAQKKYKKTVAQIQLLAEILVTPHVRMIEYLSKIGCRYRKKKGSDKLNNMASLYQ